ncbi:prepilin-type N-terminal cleavage/methylation domain-containing protein [Butyrivibrio sp. MC2013]|uniref:prepilin-type N-terminal cleavage/methylation domain-containing protein n=1 Tax=Butyrivibrio sp. MC2013 TaxID=1280686 RepID=UPI000413385C|nr:prepilin-type N-terminal cleavage/methylation domain-containing protein [Butyrivibrio sp. MC2013]
MKRSDNTGYKLHTDDKGFSLVELIIAIALLAIVGSAIMGLMVTSTTQYRRQNAQVQLQTSAQLLKNQIENRVVNADMLVYFTNDKDSEEENTDISEDRYKWILNSTGGDALLVTTGSELSKAEDGSDLISYKEGYVIWFGGDVDKLYYNECPVTLSEGIRGSKFDFAPGVDGDSFVADVEHSWALIAEDVTAFYCDVDQDNPVINVSVNMENDTADFATGFSVAKRNTAAAFSDEAGGFLNTDQPGTGQARATGVTVEPASVTMAPGQNQEFAAIVSGIGYPDQSVVWTLEGTPTDPATVIDPASGVMIVGAGETAENLTVVATTTSDEVGGLVGRGYVSIAQYTGYEIRSSNVNGNSPDNKILPGTVLNLTASLIGSNMTGSTDPDSWSADYTTPSGSPGGSVNISGSGATASLKVPSLDSGSVVRVRASASLSGKEIFGEYRFTVGSDEEVSVALTPSEAILNRGGALVFSPTVEGLSGGSEYTLTYSIADYGTLGKDMLTLSQDGTIRASSAISYNNSYTVSVEAVAKVTSQGETIALVRGSASVTIPKVTIVPQSSSVTFTSTSAAASELVKKEPGRYIGTVAVSSVSVPYTLTGIDSGNVRVVSISPSTSQISADVSGGEIVIRASAPFIKNSVWTVNINVDNIPATTTTITVQMSDE